MTFPRHYARSEAIHLSMREVTMDCFASLAMTWMGRGPDTPACVGYDAPLATRKILKAARSGFTDAGHAHVKDRSSVDIDYD